MDDHIRFSTIATMAVLILLSAFFSATETAFSSLNKAKLKVLENQGNKKATKTLELLENFDAILSSVLIGNNIVNIALASIATLFFVGILGSYGSTVSTVVITILVLLFGEITPKSLAKEHAETFAMWVTPVISVLNHVFFPLNKVFALWKNWVAKIFHNEEHLNTISDDELLTILDEATDQGGIDSMESTLIRNAIEFSDVKISEILVPRTQIKAIHKDDSIDDITAIFVDTEFSRLPVYDESLDDIIGIIHYKDFMSHVRIQKHKLESYIQPALFISPSKNIHDVLQTLQKSKKHIAIVVDEYGGTMGIVTMEDILEELVGEIFDETDEIQEKISQLDSTTFLVNASTEIDDFFAYFNLEEETESNTVGGWINEKLNGIAKAGDTFSTDGYDVLVTKADVNRALEIKFTLKQREED